MTHMEQLSEQEENYIQNLQLARLEEKKQNKKKIAVKSKNQKIQVHFPFLMFFVAIVKDITDFIPFFGLVTTPFFYLCVFFWFLSKDSRLMRKSGIKNIIGGSSALLVDLIPGLDFLPEATLFILFVYLNEKTSAKGLKKQHILKA